MSSVRARSSSPSASSSATGWHAAISAIPGLPAAAWSSETLARARERPHQRVLPTTRTDDENLHRRVSGYRACTASRPAPVPTSDTGRLERGRRRSRRSREPPTGSSPPRPARPAIPAASRTPARSGGSRTGAPESPRSPTRRGAGSGRRPGSRSNSERTSSFVSASEVIPFTRTAKRSATRSSQPQRRSRPVTVPNSPPSSRRCAPARPRDLARERPFADARDVRLRDADHLVDPVAGRSRSSPPPRPRSDWTTSRTDRSRDRDRGAFPEPPSNSTRSPATQRAMDEQRSVGDPRPDPLRVLEARREHLFGVERLQLVDALEPDVLLARRRARASRGGSSDRGDPGRGCRSGLPCRRTPGRSRGGWSRSGASRAIARARRR